MKRIAAALAVLALVLPATAQDPQFRDRIDVNVVLLDVIVTDARGNQILGLSKDDFVVKENGVEQPLESLDYFTNRRLLDQREENAPFKVEQVREERYFIFFFDKPSDAGVLTDQLNLARNAAKKFVREELKEGDRVAVAGHDVRLKIYSDFSSDRKQLERALDDASRFGRGITKPANETAEASILRGIDAGAMMNGTGTVYQALDVLADATRAIRGRKNLVLFSPGILDRSEEVRAGMIMGRSRHLDDAVQSLNAANVSVYPVQLQRNVSLETVFHQRLEEFASETGGQYFRFNTSFGPALDKIDDSNAGYYLLSYRARKERGASGFQKVDVSVKGQPQLRVTSRAGYQFGG
jgi:VWFA-related protein